MNFDEKDFIYKSKYCIKIADTDKYARIKPSSLLSFLIQSAFESSGRIGIGFKDLKVQELFWVLSRLKIKFSRALLWNEDIEIETWPRDIEKILYRRDFRICNGNENVANATSYWLAIDKTSKNIEHVNLENEWLYVALRDKHAISDPPSKIKPPELKFVEEFLPKYSEFDLNGHVSASAYLNWAINAISEEILAQHKIEEFTVNYIKETLQGEIIQSFINTTNLNSVVFEAKHKSTNKAAFRCEFKFKEAT